MLLVTADQMKKIDKTTIESFGICGIVLMENAGRSAFDIIKKRYKDLENKKVAVIAGKGNNGGDGFVVARHLAGKKAKVNVFLLSSKDRVLNDAKTNMELFEKICLHYENCSITEIPDDNAFEMQKSKIVHHDLFIDAILGTGLNFEVRGFFKKAISLLNAIKKPIFSLDIASGLNSDTGKPMGAAVKACGTASFGFAKKGQILYPSNKYTGKLKVVDIGIPKFLTKDINCFVIEKKQIAGFFQARNFESHKGNFGHLLVVAGSQGKTGAACLCANSAVRSGAGLVSLGVARSLNKIIEPQVIEPMTYALPEKEKGLLSENCFDEIQNLLKDKQAIALGPGLGTNKSTKKLVQKLVCQSNIPLVIDADGLNCIADNPKVLKQRKAFTIITPHPGEMARLCNTTIDKIQERRLDVAAKFAKEFDTIVVLKGAQTIVSFPDSKVFICQCGNPGMASGGMGDVLTGMIASFCVQGFSPYNASLAGVFIHGLCADILSIKKGSFGFIASDIIKIIPKVIHKHILCSQ